VPFQYGIVTLLNRNSIELNFRNESKVRSAQAETRNADFMGRDTSVSSTRETNMKKPYERTYRKLVSLIGQSHPRTAIKLLGIEEQFGPQAAHQAASLIVCLEARVEVAGLQAAGYLSGDDIKNFTYFEYVKDSLRALELLVELLECHVEECQAQATQSTPVEAAYNRSPVFK